MIYRNSLLIGSVVLGMIVLMPTGNASAQTITETGDAAQLPAGAQLETNKSITLITGTLGTISDIDMYRITIDDPANFSATTVGPSGPTFVADTRLFLFDASGYPVYFNDDVPDGSSVLSLLPAGDALSPTVPGDYLLAVTSYPRYPTDGSTNIFLDPEIDPVDYEDVNGPNPATSNPVSAWTGGPSADGDGDYEITITGVSGTLPIVMSLPTAIVDGNSVNLEWQTEDEEGSFGFQVEYRDALENDFRAGGFVSALGSPSTYRHSVTELRPGKHFFRIKSLAVNGGSFYSAVVEATIGVDANRLVVDAYPNPFSGSATVEVVSPDNQDVEVAVYDLIGRRVATLANLALTAGERARVNLDGTTLTSGTYVLRFDSGPVVETRLITLNR